MALKVIGPLSWRALRSSNGWVSAKETRSGHSGIVVFVDVPGSLGLSGLVPHRAHTVFATNSEHFHFVAGLSPGLISRGVHHVIRLVLFFVVWKDRIDDETS